MTRLKEKLDVVVETLVDNGVSLSQATREFERQYIVAALKRHRGNISRSARALGVHRNTLRNKIDGLEIASDEIGRSAARRR